MRIAQKTTLVVILLLLIEVLYLHVEPVSFGFPFRSVKYSSEHFNGTMEPSLGYERHVRLKVEPILLVSDVLVVLLIALLLIRCVPSSFLVPLVQGCLLGSVTGAASFWLDKILSEPWLSAIGVLIVFVVVPLIIYILSLKHKWQKTVILIISFTTVTTFGCAFLLTEALSDGVDEGFFNLGVVPRLLAFTAVLAFFCFVMMLLHRKVLPLVLRKKQLNSSLESTAHNGVPQFARHPEQTDRKSMIKKAILYASLLAITFYVGYHFMMVRKMRQDEWLVFDAIESELERLGVPQSNAILVSHAEQGIESLEASCNTSCRVEVYLNDEKIYYADVKKSIFVPWIQVDIKKTRTATQINGSHKSE